MSEKPYEGMELVRSRGGVSSRSSLGRLSPAILAICAGLLTQVAFNLDRWREGAVSARAVGGNPSASFEDAKNAVTVMQRDARLTFKRLREMTEMSDDRAELARVALQNLRDDLR